MNKRLLRHKDAFIRYTTELFIFVFASFFASKQAFLFCMDWDVS